MRVLIFHKTYGWKCSHIKISTRYCYKCILEKVSAIFSNCNVGWIFLTYFRKILKCCKHNENPCIGSRVVPCWQTEGKLDMTMLMNEHKILKCTSIIDILCIVNLQFTLCLLLFNFLLETYEIVVLQDAIDFGAVDV